jgi:hypothetical protein
MENEIKVDTVLKSEDVQCGCLFCDFAVNY